MPEDFLGSLGHLALGSRLKRIGTVLQSATQACFYTDFSDIPAAHMPVLAALDHSGPLTIGDLAAALGVAQPGISRMAASLEDGGFVETVADRSDKRVRRMRLTSRGQALVDRAKHELWPAIERAVAELCADLNGPLLTQLGGLEDKLAAGAFQTTLAKKNNVKEQRHANA